jgi:site-specific DNA-methyltransferase (adenine-specific)
MKTLHLGDCLEVLRGMPDCSVDAVVTDPPYGLSFMGKKWDYDVPAVEVWAECLRVLKPGGHLLAFAGTRTQHRMAVRIEDAGFEIRDMIAWVYGSGFPKSLDVSKAIDKADGAEREIVGPNRFAHLNGKENTNCYGKASRPDESAPATDAARQWQGWGTALKPALEPITVARKPLIGTVAANVLEHGTGALNVDGCRVDLNGDYKCRANGRPSQTGLPDNYEPAKANQPDTAGRWPANLIHDGSDEVVGLFPQSKGQQGALTGAEPSGKTANAFGEFAARSPSEPRGDSGSAARFFYCAKASKSDRGENNHPTVKPTDLMRYLCRLVTPPGGVVLDPFMGSGSTGKAALLEGFKFVGIERDLAYFEIANARIKGDKQMSLL